MKGARQRALPDHAAMRSPLPSLQRPPSRQPVANWQLQQRATLEGLEVSDSTWEEWVACAERQAQPKLPGSVKQ